MKTFKEYRKEKAEKLQSMETSFGTHSIPQEKKKAGEKYPMMETSMGSHSISKEDRKVQEAYRNATITEPEPSDDEHDELHSDTFQASKENVSESESSAIKEYTDDSTRLNTMHRDIYKGKDVSHPKYDKMKNQTKHLDSAMAKHTSNKSAVLYTGIKDSPVKHFKKVNGELPSTVKVTLPAYTSTSTSPNVAREFAADSSHVNDLRHGITEPTVRHILKIHAPKGTHAMSMKEFSWVPTENEVLLHRDHDIEIHKTPMHVGNNTYIWHARIIPK